MCLLFCAATAFFNAGGVQGQAYLKPSRDSNDDSQVFINRVRIETSTAIPRWQIHELPVDLSLDPKLRCRSQHIGRALQFSGKDQEIIHGVPPPFLVLRSLVLLVNNETVSCASIIPMGLPDFVGSIAFKSGVLGWMYIAQWKRECTVDTHA